MFSITIVFGPGPSMWQLLFKTEDAAHTAASEISKGREIAYGGTIPASFIVDDFGHTAYISFREIHGFMLEDLEVSKMGHIELALHQARTQAKAQTMGQADPMLRAAGLMNAGNGAVGPAMLAPGFGRG